MSTFLSLRSWVAPGHSRRALLIHGGHETGNCWYKVALGLLAAGYNVDAPDTLGHGFTKTTEPSSSLVPEKHAQFLSANLPTPPEPYSLVAGVSLGSYTAMKLLPLLPTPPERMVLIEPPIEVTVPPPMYARVLDMVANPPSEDQIQAQNPSWTTEDCIEKRMGYLKCDPVALEQVFLGIRGVSHSEVLPESTSTEIIVLAADSTKMALYNPDQNALRLQKERPYVKMGMVKGSSHNIHKDNPAAVIDALLGKLEQNKDIVIHRP